MSLLTKVAKGIAFGDVSNYSVRNILTEISNRIYGRFTEEDMRQTMEYFDWKCPYTGKDLRDAIENNLGGYATDHIYPQNKEFCGLNVKGNLVIVDKLANSKKGNQSIDSFMTDRKFDAILGDDIKERENRLKKIKDFQKSFGYDPAAIKRTLSPLLSERYNEVREEQEQTIDNCLSALGKTTPVHSYSTSKPAIKKKGVPELFFYPIDEELFKKKLIESKKARIILTYESGDEKQKTWNIKHFDTNSSLKANIQSRPFWRDKDKDGLVKVEVRV